MAPDGFLHIAEYLSPDQQSQLLAEIRAAIAAAPLYIPTMPRTGKPLSVQMTNCGPLGWVTDKVGGYRYQAHHPDTGRAWPPIPDMLKTIWADVAPTAPPPEACLINCYAADSRLGLHCDADEAEFTAPVVSLSLGDDAWFRIGGLKRRDPTTRIR
ncbi:MAG: alpha-ketoglutarate-dependent dioxygenase AlkB, partial [Pseudomonadota bacterium]